MKYTLSLFLTLGLIAISCTKKQDNTNKTTPNKSIQYASEIKYFYDSGLQGDEAAMVADTPVTWSQLLSQDVALQELQNTLDEKALVFAYAWALSLSPIPSILEFSGPKPQTELKSLIEKNSLEFNDSLEITYAETNDFKNLAKANDKTLNWKDFLNSSMSHSKLYMRVFNQRMQRLNGIVVRRFLLQASKDEKTPMEEFVGSKILKTSVEPSTEDIYVFAKSKGISETDLNETMMERLKEIIKQEDRDQKIESYVAKNLVKKPIAVAFPNPELQVTPPDLDADVPHWGKKDETKLVYVGHLDCENCATPLRSFLDTKNKWSDNVSGYFIYSFQENNREARMGAEAAFCVESINGDSFWTFLSKMLDLENDNLEEKINMAAKESNVDFEDFRSCFLKRNFQEKVNSHLEYAQKMGVTTTPVMILQNVVLDSLSVEDLNNKIKEAGVAAKSHLSMWARIKSFFGF